MLFPKIHPKQIPLKFKTKKLTHIKDKSHISLAYRQICLFLTLIISKKLK